MQNLLVQALALKIQSGHRWAQSKARGPAVYIGHQIALSALKSGAVISAISPKLNQPVAIIMITFILPRPEADLAKCSTPDSLLTECHQAKIAYALAGPAHLCQTPGGVLRDKATTAVQPFHFRRQQQL